MNHGRGLFWPRSFGALCAEYGSNLSAMARASGIPWHSLDRYAKGTTRPMKRKARAAFCRTWDWTDVELPEQIVISKWGTVKDRAWQDLLYWLATGLMAVLPPASHDQPNHEERMRDHARRIRSNEDQGRGRTSHARRTA